MPVPASGAVTAAGSSGSARRSSRFTSFRKQRAAAHFAGTPGDPESVACNRAGDSSRKPSSQ